MNCKTKTSARHFTVSPFPHFLHCEIPHCALYFICFLFFDFSGSISSLHFHASIRFGNIVNIRVFFCKATMTAWKGKKIGQMNVFFIVITVKCKKKAEISKPKLEPLHTKSFHVFWFCQTQRLTFARNRHKVCEISQFALFKHHFLFKKTKA